jgi:uncharacterized RDD family membrane protein YckC
MYCSHCGSELESGSEFCTNCGNKVSAAHPGTMKKPDIIGTVSPPAIGQPPVGEPVPQIRPWVRFFARFIDFGWSYLLTMGIFVVFGVFFYLLNPKIDFSNIPPFMDILITTMTTFLVLALIEPFFISKYGQTPGKWLFKTRVMKSDGSLLTFSQAMDRSLSVYIRGYLLGIPFLNFITLLIESSKLEKEGKTTWDRKGGFIVRHEKIGILRVIVAVVILVLLRIFMIGMTPKY